MVFRTTHLPVNRGLGEGGDVTSTKRRWVQKLRTVVAAMAGPGLVRSDNRFTPTVLVGG